MKTVSTHPLSSFVASLHRPFFVSESLTSDWKILIASFYLYRKRPLANILKPLIALIWRNIVLAFILWFLVLKALTKFPSVVVREVKRNFPDFFVV